MLMISLSNSRADLVRPDPGSLRVIDSGLFALDVRRPVPQQAGRSKGASAVVIVGPREGPIWIRRVLVIPCPRDLAVAGPRRVRRRIRPVVLVPRPRRLVVRVRRHGAAQDVLEDRE